MRKLKKILVIILAFVFVMSFTACGGKDGKTDKPAETDKPAATDTPAGTETPDAQNTPEEPEASEPLDPTPGSVTIGDVTLSAEFIKLDEPMTLSSGNNPCMAVSGDTVYIGDGEKTKKYTLADNTLTLVKTFDIANRGGLSIDGKGQLYADGGSFPAKIYDGEGNQVGEAAEKGNISNSQTEDFALAYYSGRDAVTKISGGAAETWVISGLKSGDPAQIKGPFTAVKNIEVVGNHALVAGTIEKEQKLVVFDTAGNEIARSSEKLSGNGISALTETNNGYMTASVSAIHLMKKDGTFIGEGKSTNSLFGVEKYVTIKKLVPMGDGSVLLLCKGTRADGTGEALLYRIKGF